MNDRQEVRIEVKSCVECGACCRRSWGVLADEWVPLHLTMRAFNTEEGKESTYMRQKSNGSCIALNELTNKCIIYDQRPMVCRQFKRMSEQCLDAVIEFRPEFIKGAPQDLVKSLQAKARQTVRRMGLR